MLNLTPRQIVTELDRYVIGQAAAKRALALTARNFWRMRQLKSGVPASLLYRNILMIGPTGSGKTSLARYFSDVIGLGFHHVPVTQFVSEGYRGFNISDLTESVSQSRKSISPITQAIIERYGLAIEPSAPQTSEPVTTPQLMFLSSLAGTAQFSSNTMTDGNLILLDEFDKLDAGVSAFSDNRREVQQELLSLLENPTYSAGARGYVNSDMTNCMFICAGAFSSIHQFRKLMPELQGRLPTVVELEKLKLEDYVRILQESDDSPIAQINNMLRLENVEVELTAAAVHKLANAAFRLNQSIHNLGARRLHQIAQKLFDDISFRSPELNGQKVLIDENYFMFSIFEKEYQAHER